ncbi:MAG: CotH kinase family protein [Bacteroidales bacterium]|nr:CotH kinase family protein [Bacteroidales bacterium]
MIFKQREIKYSLWSLLLLAVLSSCYEEVYMPSENTTRYNYLISFNNVEVGVDTASNFLLYTVGSLNVEDLEVEIRCKPVEIVRIEGNDLKLNNSYHFEDISFSKAYPVEIRMEDGTIETYQLHFSPLPVIQIYPEESIKNEPKSLSWTSVSRAPDQGGMISCYMGIEYRGGSAMGNPKLSYGIEFWDDMYESGHRDVSFFNLLADDDWILDAMYVDKARFRNAISWDIWNDLQLETPNVNADKSMSCHGGYVEVFLKGQYIGLYRLSERFDRKRLQIRSTEEGNAGYLYKSEGWDENTRYVGIVETHDSYIWGGWELKYPKEPRAEVWQPLYDFVSFVINSDDEEFQSQIFQMTDRDNLIDYLIYINMIKATDNYGKNVIMAKYDAESKFYHLPWDLDATWGRSWLAEEESEEGILRNVFYMRLFDLNPGEMVPRLQDRWEQLKAGIYSPENINKRIDAYGEFLEASGAMEREINRWPECELNLSGELSYLKDWYQRRYDFMDEFFTSL